MVGAGCDFETRGGRLVVRDAHGTRLLVLDFMSARAARLMGWAVATLAANLEEDFGPEEVRRLLSAEAVES